MCRALSVSPREDEASLLGLLGSRSPAGECTACRAAVGECRAPPRSAGVREVWLLAGVASRAPERSELELRPFLATTRVGKSPIYPLSLRMRVRSVSQLVGVSPRPGLSNLDRNRDPRCGDVLLEPEFSPACMEAVREAAFLPGSRVRLTPQGTA